MQQPVRISPSVVTRKLFAWQSASKGLDRNKRHLVADKFQCPCRGPQCPEWLNSDRRSIFVCPRCCPWHHVICKYSSCKGPEWGGVVPSGPHFWAQV